MNVFTIWLVLVVAWNFGYPDASPLEDVIVAIILSLFSTILKKYFKKVRYRKSDCYKEIMGWNPLYKVMKPKIS